jgi:hypothetical protein
LKFTLGKEKEKKKKKKKWPKRRNIQSTQGGMISLQGPWLELELAC